MSDTTTTGASIARVALAAAFGLAGCAVGPMTPVDGSDRDVSGVHDGLYRLRLGEKRGFQTVATWRMGCATGGFDIPMNVVAGTARLRTRFDDAKKPNAPVTAFVDGDGRFRFEVPITHVMTASGTSSATLDNGDMKLIYQGELEAGGTSRGVYTEGVGEFGYAGCSYRFDIVPDGVDA